MSSIVRSVGDIGASGLIVDIECHLSKGLPAMIIVGSANKSIDEAKERVRSSFASADLNFPKKRITINLAPADLPKEGTGYDLAIAAAILLASQQVKAELLDETVVIGELGLDGKVRPVRGIIGKILSARSKGFKTFFIPQANLKQAILVPGVKLIPIKTVREFYLVLTATLPIKKLSTSEQTKFMPLEKETYKVDLSDIIGQERAKRGLEISAAGGHNLFLNGPPGTGKTMLAK
ncbi:MAG TPA: magnesium chelatase domain-containing protein, partial [Patescibacteria group bacterium]|nr:magnesium chelatase domain-containing protein [Patescibacteria group bacterium]